MKTRVLRLVCASPCASCSTSCIAPSFHWTIFCVRPDSSMTHGNTTTLKQPMRIGHGFDLHRLEPGRRLVVGGVEIPHDRGCVAHSDGDVVYHSVTDAILGALAMQDIGQLFPDDDSRWKDAASDVFVREAVRRMKAAGYEVGNVDVTIVLQRPRISPHKQEVVQHLAELLCCDTSQVNVKGKTHERVDAIGQEQAIACHVVALLLRST